MDCTECGLEMLDGGKDIKIPRKNNKREWKKLELIFTSGFDWNAGCGCYGPGELPVTLGDARAWSERKRARKEASRYPW